MNQQDQIRADLLARQVYHLAQLNDITLKLQQLDFGDKPLPRKNRPTDQAFSSRNDRVTMMARKFDMDHGHRPTISDLVVYFGGELSYQQIYKTDAFKNGLILTRQAKNVNNADSKSIVNRDFGSDIDDDDE